MTTAETQPSPSLAATLSPRISAASSSSSSPGSCSPVIHDRTVDYDDVSGSSSEDEEGGVFLGTRTDAESRFLAQLTKPPGTPSPIKRPSKRQRRQSRLVSRLRRDSTEFHRRATMVFPIPERHDEEEADQEQDDHHEDSMMQERYQREVSVLQISPSVLASARKHAPRKSNQLLFPSFEPLDDSESSDDDDSSEHSIVFTVFDRSVESNNPESDKENERISENMMRDDVLHHPGSPFVSLAGCTDVQAEYPGEAGHLITGYSQSASAEHDGYSEVLGLDLGGLSLKDFGDADAEQETAVLDALTNLAITYTSDTDETPDRSPRSAPSPAAIDPVSVPHTAPSPASPAIVSLEIASEEVEEGETMTHDAAPVEPAEDDDEPGSIDLRTTEEVAASPEAVEGDSDLDPLPIPRANPPMFAMTDYSPIRASGSPFRSPPTRTEANLLSPPSLPQFVVAPRIDEKLQSPSRTPTRPTSSETPFTARTPRQLGPLPTTATPCQTREDMVPLPDRTTKILKSQTMTSHGSKSSESLSVPAKKDKSRALAVRGQLDAVFTNRAGRMGPPQRTVSASSSQSSSSSTGRPPSRLDVEKAARKVPTSTKTIPTRPGSGLARAQPATTLAKSVSTTGLPASKRPNPALSSSLARPTVPAAKPPVPAVRQALAPRSLVTHPAKQPVAKAGSLKPARPVEASLQAVATERPPAVVSSAPVNPLKRPFQTGGYTVPVRQPGQAASVTRPALGLPSRLVWNASQGRHAQTFHVSAAPENTMARIVVKSPARQASHQRQPGTPSGSRAAMLGTPSRSDGTPRSIRAKPSFPMLATSASAPKDDVAEVQPSTTDGPPATATRHASEHQVTSQQTVGDEQHRGSSEDYEDVSRLLPDPPSSQSTAASSPAKQSASPSKRTSPQRQQRDGSDSAKEGKAASSSPVDLRPKRAVKPPASRGRSVSSAPAPWMSGKELKTTTDRNTMRNQVYLCAIDRQIVRKSGPRPPSPTSKIRTTADRDEEEKKKSREHRAKRRARDSDNTAADDEAEHPRIEKVERLRGPGDDEDWRTPARPAKKAKIGMDKTVKWDKALVIIRDDGSGVHPPTGTEFDEPARSCLREEAKVQLDKHGNLVTTTRPTENLKRSKVVVTAVFYDGEEPVPVPDFPSVQDTSGTKGGGKKKK